MGPGGLNNSALSPSADSYLAIDSASFDLPDPGIPDTIIMLERLESVVTLSLSTKS